MSIDRKSYYCHECQSKKMHERQRFSGGWGCLLTILTGGLFIPIWLLLNFLELFSPFRCIDCGEPYRRGRKIENDKPSRIEPVVKLNIVKVECPACEKITSVPESYLGKKGTCNNCKTSFIIGE